MDQFLLTNASLFQSLVKAYKPKPVAKSRKAEEKSCPDMVVSARVRPLLEDDIATGFPSAVFPRPKESGVVDIYDLYNHPRGRPALQHYNYEVDRLYGSEASTEEIYHDLVADLLPFAWNGGIGTLFAYGQTGSGKTYTVSRLEELAVEALLEGGMAGTRKVSISIFELAGNSAYDLLSSRKSASVIEDSFGVMHVAGAAEHVIQSKKEAMEFIESAASFRRTASTVKNDTSSRSHAICRIRIENPAESSDGFLYLVDLAGSEAARDVAVHGADRMRETREINTSLSVLKDCIRGKVQADILAAAAARRGQKAKRVKPHVPFRQSALTKVLKHVFDPSGTRACRTVVIACVNPSLADVRSSKNTLRYAEMLRVMVPATGTAEADPLAPMTWANAQLKEWIAKNSGTPSINGDTLAPTESGAQLLRIPATQFESRCLETPGVSIEQVRAFRSKLWQMHIDSQHSGEAPSTTAPSTAAGVPKSATSSRNLDPRAEEVSFKKRIRPGMAVDWDPSSSPYSTFNQLEGKKFAVVLCPVEAATPFAKDMLGKAVSEYGNEGEKYLCALVTPGIMAEAYEVNLWHQVVIDVDMMNGEAILEYDSGTRYYYLSV